MLALETRGLVRCRGEACRVFKESIVVLLKSVDLEEIIVSARKY